MTVRIATRADEPEIIRLLHLMHSEGGLLSLNVEAAQELFARAFDRKGGIIGVIGDKVIEAMIYLLITRFWYTRDNHIEELFNFVAPEHRRSEHAKSLIAFAKDCSQQIGLPLVIGVMTNKRMAPKVRLYRTQLGCPAGAFFVFNSKWDQEPSSEDFWASIGSRSDRRRSAKQG